MSERRLILASGSPRRAELLKAAGIDFDVIVADVDEAIRPRERPLDYVARLAEEKAFTVLPHARNRPVLGADTVVVVDDEVLGKPADAADATRMLRMLSGRQHQVMTGVALIPAPKPSAPTGRAAEVRNPDLPPYESIVVNDGIEVTTVEFARMTDAEIAEYIVSGEPMDKAGGYAIQGLASRFVTRIEGSYSNVVGLPVALVYNLCKRAGLLVF